MLRTSGQLFKQQPEGPPGYQRVNILIVDKRIALESIGSRSSARPPAKQEVPLRKHSNFDSFFVSSSFAHIFLSGRTFYLCDLLNRFNFFSKHVSEIIVKKVVSVGGRGGIELSVTKVYDTV